MYNVPKKEDLYDLMENLMSDYKIRVSDFKLELKNKWEHEIVIRIYPDNWSKNYYISCRLVRYNKKFIVTKIIVTNNFIKIINNPLYLIEL